MANRNLGTTPTSIICQLGYIYQLSFHHANLESYLLNFAQAPADLEGSNPKLVITNSKK
jgi:hypothetical protein